MTAPIQKLAESMVLEHSLGMTEKKLKFLLFSAQQVFGVKDVYMTFDATKTVPAIVLTPEKNGTYFTKEEWEEQDKQLDFDKTCQNLQKFLGVAPHVKIVFKRTVPKVRK